MVSYPLVFEVYAEALAGVGTPWTTQQNSLAPLSIAIPPEFNGPGGHYTPEDLLTLSLLNCIIAMFKFKCEKNQILFGKIKGKAVAKLDIDQANNQLFISTIDVTLDVEGSSNIERAKELLDSSVKTCPVTNSLKTGKTFHLNVS
jgi:organic hydroperoxide reductase OsmC/OhrA